MIQRKILAKNKITGVEITFENLQMFNNTKEFDKNWEFVKELHPVSNFSYKNIEVKVIEPIKPAEVTNVKVEPEALVNRLEHYNNLSLAELRRLMVGLNKESLKILLNHDKKSIKEFAQELLDKKRNK